MLILKKRWVKSILLFSLFCVCAIYAQRFSHIQTDGFSISRITSKLSFHPEWEVSSLSLQDQREVSSALNQRYSYLAKGAQCHVFVSSDEQYVLKFFRQSHMRPAIWLTALPSFFEPFRTKKINKKWGKLHKDFRSYVLAHTQFKDETGLIYLHLNKTKHLSQTVTIVDKIGIAHNLDLDGMEFILQKRADLVYPAIDAWMDENQQHVAKEAITNLITLLKSRFQKGLYDKDPDLNTNFGFIHKKAVQIDIGRFKRIKTLLTENEQQDNLLRITDNLKQWLDCRYPQLSDHLQKELRKR